MISKMILGIAITTAPLDTDYVPGTRLSADHTLPPFTWAHFTDKNMSSQKLVNFCKVTWLKAEEPATEPQERWLQGQHF